MPGTRMAFKYARRLYPLALAAWRRWDSLEEHEKERYRALAGQYAKRGRAFSSQAMRRGQDVYTRARGKS